ncbi:methyltransferase-like protein 27 isoform X3 [Sebastes umbrosus]|uniref:methyltransferase-like protein 27 isoform X3 n=1 Tax=Sebastes umbrosus TaxID=72105 RepID=UPI00189DD500|nr:methyltransferase-like protein 27 isoform X3 [Sebastes umbrosus]
MSDSVRTEDDVRVAFQSCKSPDAKDQVQFYDSWAENYEKDVTLLSYRAPYLAVDFLSDNFSGSPEEARVLDVACGSGWVAKLMVELGFMHFVGVDSSKGMLEQAAKTSLYQDLKLALLGTEPLPAQTGGFVCIARGDHRGTPANEYKKDLERELQLMEEDGLWSPVGLKQTDRYMEDPHLSPEILKSLQKEERYLSGSFYLYRKSIH